MLVCVSANPAIDRRLQLESIAVGEVNRAVSARPFPGGKAAHVAIVAKATVGCGDAALAGFAVAHALGLRDEDTLCLAVACRTANCLAESPGLVDPLEVERILQQVSVQPLPADWREVKTRGGAG